MSASNPLRTLAVAGNASNMDITIRVASASDVPFMHQLRSKVRENRLSNPKQISEATYLPYVEAGSTWVAEAETTVLGFAALDKPSMSVWFSPGR